MALLLEKPRDVADGHFIMRLDIGTENSNPGQFVNIRIGDSLDPLLRRPFSIHDHSGNIVDIVVRVVGRGTSWLREHAMPGEIDVLAPLGKGFTLMEKGTVLLAGGGVGNAPLYYLGRKLREMGNRVHYVYGCRSGDCLYLDEKYRSIADVFRITTDDGSCGDRGFAADAAAVLAERHDYDAVYTCGPAVMMAGITEIFRDTRSLIEVSMENYFGCGVGLCSGCTVETVDGNRRACVDGPVMDGRAVLWDSMDDDTGALSGACR